MFKTKLYCSITDKNLKVFVFLESCVKQTDEDKELAEVFFHIISMTVQLKYIFIERLDWFLFISEYVSTNFVSSSEIPVLKFNVCV